MAEKVFMPTSSCHRDAESDLASCRNIKRLLSKLELPDSRGEGLRIAVALKQPAAFSVSNGKQDAGSDSCCPLPLSLQDLCLLVVVSDLDLYPVELLASLPLWLRHRLLGVVPAVDLCRLERTPVAAGVDVDAIWSSESRWGAEQKPGSSQSSPYLQLGGLSALLRGAASKIGLGSSSTKNCFQLNVQSGGVKVAESEIPAALLDPEQCCKLPQGKKYLMQIASDLLSTTAAWEMSINQLISIKGEAVFSNLLTGSMHQLCSDPQCSHSSVWCRQAVGLAVNIHTLRQPMNRPVVNSVQLTPHRLLHILHKRDPMQLLSLLTKDCSLRPSTANIHIESMSASFLQELSAEMLLLESKPSLPPDGTSMPHTSILISLLESVSILKLQCDSYNKIGVMIGMIKAVTMNGANSQLKRLSCTLPNIYMDVVEPFLNLFSLQNFQQLHITLAGQKVWCEVNILMFMRLLQGFMSAPCSQVQKMVIHTGISLPTSLKTSQLAAVGTPIALPSSIAQYKSLQFNLEDEFTKALYLILQLPTVRLRELVLVSLNKYKYLHLCAMHPNLQARKLVIDTGGNSELQSSVLATITHDFAVLFAKQALEKIVICGVWGAHMEVKLGLVQGLRVRSHLSPLKKLSLELHLADSYKMRDFQLLCDAIFSLPQLQNLKLVLGKGFAIMLRQPGYENIMYLSWVQMASSVQLKSICLQTYDSTFKQLLLVTPKLTFSTESKRYPHSHHTDDFLGGSMYLGEFGFGGYDSDDDFGFPAYYGYGGHALDYDDDDYY